MKIKFSEFLKEYRHVPQSAELPLNQLTASSSNNAEILPTSITTSMADFIIIEQKRSRNNTVFVIKDRDKPIYVGYCFIKRISEEFWQVQDTTIYNPYKNKGYGTDLYVNIRRHSYQLLSGFSLSKQAENIWVNKLPKFVNVSVYDKVENKILPFSDLPQKDMDEDNNQQRYFLLHHQKSHWVNL